MNIALPLWLFILYIVSLFVATIALAEITTAARRAHKYHTRAVRLCYIASTLLCTSGILTMIVNPQIGPT